MLIPRLGSPARDEASARSIVAGLIRATRSIVSADTWRKACQWRKRSRSSGRKGARRLEQMPSVGDQHMRRRATSAVLLGAPLPLRTDGAVSRLLAGAVGLCAAFGIVAECGSLYAAAARNSHSGPSHRPLVSQ